MLDGDIENFAWNSTEPISLWRVITPSTGQHSSDWLYVALSNNSLYSFNRQGLIESDCTCVALTVSWNSVVVHESRAEKLPAIEFKKWYHSAHASSNDEFILRHAHNRLGGVLSVVWNCGGVARRTGVSKSNRCDKEFHTWNWALVSEHWFRTHLSFTRDLQMLFFVEMNLSWIAWFVCWRSAWHESVRDVLPRTVFVSAVVIRTTGH